MAAAAEELGVEKTSYEGAPSLDVDRTQRDGHEDATWTEGDNREERRELVRTNLPQEDLFEENEMQVSVSTKENADGRQISPAREKRIGMASPKAGTAISGLTNLESGKPKASAPRSKSSKAAAPGSGKSKSSTPAKKKSVRVRSGSSEKAMKSSGPNAKEVKEKACYEEVPSLKVDRTQRGGREDVTWTEGDEREEQRELAGMSFFKEDHLKEDHLKENVAQVHVSTKENAVERETPSVRIKKMGSAFLKAGSVVSKLASLRSGKSKASTPKSKKLEAASPGADKAKAATPGSDKAKAATPRSDKAKAATPRSDKSKAATPRSDKSKSSIPRMKKSVKVRIGSSKKALKSTRPNAKEVKKGTAAHKNLHGESSACKNTQQQQLNVTAKSNATNHKK